MSTVKETSKSLFNTLYEGSSEVIKAMKKPLVARRVKRRLQAARDSAIEKKDSAESTLFKVRENLADFNVQSIIDARQEVVNADNTIQHIREEYKTLFGESMPEE